MNNWKEREAAVDADRLYIELKSVATDLRNQTDALKQELVQATYKLQRFLILRDVALEQMWKLEDTDQDTDTMLKDLTANNGEAWCGMVSQSVEDLQGVIFDLCEIITRKRGEHTHLDQQRRNAWDVAHTRAREVREEFDANQAATPKEDN